VRTLVLKVTGAQGQGVNSVGEMCARGLKRAGYCVFGVREYNSLIKGGHSSYQLDVSNEHVRSSQQEVDLLVCFNHHGLERNVGDVREGGIIIHQTPDWTWSAEQLAELRTKRITLLHLPVDALLEKLKAKAILGNVLISGVVWELLGRPAAEMEALVREQFGHKVALLDQNLACLAEARAFVAAHPQVARLSLPKADARWSQQLLVTGSQAMGLGVVHAGVRFYAGYPMTPSSPLLTFIAGIQDETRMVIKQAEDEITAIQMVSGAMHAGTRALTATSGGGFDLMTETLSLNAIIENPCVVVLAQRPGPATGLPTWTAQGDLLLALHSGHGEFARCVVSVSDSDDAFHLMPVAFNLAEEWQIPVIVLTDKQIAEALYTQAPFDTSATELRRGALVTEPAQLAQLTASHRYDPHTENGVSVRWLPGSEADTYVAQGDEHAADGSVDESAHNAVDQMDKRLRKLEGLREQLPEPVLYGAAAPRVLLIGWGSTKDPILDALREVDPTHEVFGYLHVTYLWPLRTERLLALHRAADKTILFEGNAQGQLGMLLAQEAHLTFDERILKYDGRPFLRDEVVDILRSLLPPVAA
jgi:2-oxoglutarate/2-oxoacid ferredoxin oxidoreductase subunit alpha